MRMMAFYDTHLTPIPPNDTQNDTHIQLIFYIFLYIHTRKKRKENPRKPCNFKVYGGFHIGEPSGIRTPGPLIKSQMLCQLS